MKRFAPTSRIFANDRTLSKSLIVLLIGSPLLLCCCVADPAAALLAFLFVLLAPILLWATIRRVKNLKRVIRTGTEVQARVANIESYKEGKGFSHTVIRVTCDYEYDGETYRFEESTDYVRWISKLEAGDELTLIVDPENPANAVIARLYSDGTPGTPPTSSELGGLVGGSICSLGLLCVYWLPVLWGEKPFTVFGQITEGVGFLFWSVMSVGYGLVFGAIAGMFARPYRSAVLGGILLGFPALLFRTLSYMKFESLHDGLLSWICALFVGTMGGLIGGIVGQKSLDRQLQILGPALAVQRKAEELAAAQGKRAAEMEAAKEAAELAKEAAELEAAEAAANVDRCLSCGHVMESYVTCPRCGWSYLQKARGRL